jgi:hypothetical protein
MGKSFLLDTVRHISWHLDSTFHEKFSLLNKNSEGNDSPAISLNIILNKFTY